MNSALGKVQEALKGTDIAAIKSAMEKLATESQKLGVGAVRSSRATPARPGPTHGAPVQQQSDGRRGRRIVDAEIVDEDKK